jgi:hypothetical protein
MTVLQTVTHKVLQATHGRTTAFFVAFFITGNAMAYFDKLTPVYVGFMGTLGGLVLGHSVKEDLVTLKNKALGGDPPPAPGGPDGDNK